MTVSGVNIPRLSSVCYIQVTPRLPFGDTAAAPARYPDRPEEDGRVLRAPRFVGRNGPHRKTRKLDKRSRTACRKAGTTSPRPEISSQPAINQAGASAGCGCRR